MLRIQTDAPRESLIRLDDKKSNVCVAMRSLCKVYPNGTKALDEVTLDIRKNEFIVIIGLSGAGKSTLLRCINRLIRPTSGSLELFGEDIINLSGRRLRQVRRRVGMIFQQFNLVHRLSVLNNVIVGRLRFNASPVKHTLSLLKLVSKQEKEAAFHCLQQVGIADLAFRRADTLSGGQQQRVAIARALAQDPEIFLADEPIASLDPRSSETVMDTLAQIHEERNIPVVVNLHHVDYAKRYGKQILGMSHGQLVFQGCTPDLTQETLIQVYGRELDEVIGESTACALP
jgi:phosphonate transport system ATP-binding protein